MPGFKAMITSILRHTIEFKENFVCIDLGLTQKDKNECLLIHPNLQFVPTSRKHYRKVPIHAPALSNAFHKLEIFRLAQLYDRVLFIDCDIVFVDSIQPLLNIVPETDLAAVYHASQHEYNTGVMVLRRLTPNPYKKIMKLLKTEERAWLGDQTIIKKAINKKIISVSQLDHKWNVTKRQVLRKSTKFVGLHFVGKKPWKGGEPGYEDIESIWHSYNA